MKKPVHTHTAPYYGGEKMARTLEEAFGPGAKLHTSRRPSWLRRNAPTVLLFVSAGVVIVSFLAALVQA